MLERHLRKGDQAARYGGEEFAAILPGAEEKGALHLAERVREAIAASRVVFEGARLNVTVSLGVAVWPADGKDERVHRQPRPTVPSTRPSESGRNRVVAASTAAGAGLAVLPLTGRLRAP